MRNRPHRSSQFSSDHLHLLQAVAHLSILVQRGMVWDGLNSGFQHQARAKDKVLGVGDGFTLKVLKTLLTERPISSDP